MTIELPSSPTPVALDVGGPSGRRDVRPPPATTSDTTASDNAASDNTASGTTARGRRRVPGWHTVAAVGAPGVVYAVHAASYGPWIVDDAAITFAYVRSITEGLGPVLQPGAEPVEGFSNPTWLAVLALARVLGLFDRGPMLGLPDIVLLPKLLGGLCVIGVLAQFHGVARALGRPWWVTALLGTVCVLVPSFTIWTTSGLENGLFVLLVVGVAATLARAALSGRLLGSRTAVACGLLGAAATLTRPDGAIYVAAYPLVLLALVRPGTLRVSLRAGATSAGAAAVPIGLYLAWRIRTFGDWLPTTARAKSQGVPGLVDLTKAADLLVYAGWATSVGAVVVVTVVLQRRSPTRTAVAALLVPTALAVLAFAVLDWDWMAQARFATPVWALGILTAGLATTEVLARGSARGRVAVAGATAAALLLSAAGWVPASTAFADRPTTPLCWVARDTGENVDGLLDVLGVRSGSLLAVDAGGTALVSRLRLIDLAGLTDSSIARFWQRDDMAGLRTHVLEVRRPTFVKTWRTSYSRAGLLEDPRFARDYVWLWAPEPEVGLWVRREAVVAPESIVVARAAVASAQERLQSEFDAADGHARWRCPSRLSTSS